MAASVIVVRLICVEQLWRLSLKNSFALFSPDYLALIARYIPLFPNLSVLLCCVLKFLNHFVSLRFLVLIVAKQVFD